MKKKNLLVRRIAVPIITLMLLVTSWAPTMHLSDLSADIDIGKSAIMEIYNNHKKEDVVAIGIDYNQIQKHYDVRVFIDSKDNEVIFPANMGRPFIAEGRTFTPYRIMCENLGAEVDWDEGLRKVTANGNDSVVELFIGDQNYKVNGETREMDVEPFILASEGRTYIPARYLTEGLDYKIDFAQDGKVMFICSFTKGQSDAKMKAVLEEIVAENKIPEVNLENPEGLRVIHDPQLVEMFKFYKSKGYNVELSPWTGVINNYGCIRVFGNKNDANKEQFRKDVCDQVEIWLGKEAAEWMAVRFSWCDRPNTYTLSDAKIVGEKAVGIYMNRSGRYSIEFDADLTY